MKSNETDTPDDQWNRLVELWPRLTPAVRTSILKLVEGAARMQQLNHGRRGGVHLAKTNNILHMEILR